MTEEQFLKFYSSYYGEVVDNINQLTIDSFDGKELHEFITAAIKFASPPQTGDAEEIDRIFHTNANVVDNMGRQTMSITVFKKVIKKHFAQQRTEEGEYERGFSDGYNEATKEAIKEIHKNYKPDF